MNQLIKNGQEFKTSRVCSMMKKHSLGERAMGATPPVQVAGARGNSPDHTRQDSGCAFARSVAP